MSNEYLIEMKRIISHIAMGSTLMHGGHNYLGREMDGKTICILAYLLHSALIDALGITNPKILDLSKEPRGITALQISQKLNALYATEPNTVEWGKFLYNSNYPHDFNNIFGCLVMFLAILLIPSSIADWAAHTLTSMFLTPDQSKYILQVYYAEIREATKDLSVPILEWLELVRLFAGMILKMFFAFFY